MPDGWGCCSALLSRQLGSSRINGGEIRRSHDLDAIVSSRDISVSRINLSPPYVSGGVRGRRGGIIFRVLFGPPLPLFASLSHVCYFYYVMTRSDLDMLTGGVKAKGRTRVLLKDFEISRESTGLLQQNLRMIKTFHNKHFLGHPDSSTTCTIITRSTTGISPTEVTRQYMYSVVTV